MHHYLFSLFLLLMSATPAWAECPTTPVQLVVKQRIILLNGQAHAVAGPQNWRAFERYLNRCDMPEAAKHFRKWRANRRATNLLVPGVSYGLPLIPAILATYRKERMKDVIHKEIIARNAEGPELDPLVPEQIPVAPTVADTRPLGMPVTAPKPPPVDPARSARLAAQKRASNANLEISALVKQGELLDADAQEKADRVGVSWTPVTTQMEALDNDSLNCVADAHGASVIHANEASERCEGLAVQARSALEQGQQNLARLDQMVGYHNQQRTGRAMVMVGTGVALAGGVTTVALNSHFAEAECAESGCPVDVRRMLPGLVMMGVGGGLYYAGVGMMERGTTGLKVQGRF